MVKSNKNSTNKIRKIYLDYASSALSASANPGAIHQLGVKEKIKLEEARTIVAKILNTRDNEIIFTSGATESNNLAILGLVQNFKQYFNLPHIITTNIEHTSVLEVFRHLGKTKQAEVTYVEVERNGIVDIKKIKKALKLNTVLVSVMYANNEIGAIQPVREIAKEIRHWKKNKKGKVGFLETWERDGASTRNFSEGKYPYSKNPALPVFHTDATQAVNYLPINVPRLGVNLMSFNSAKIYGPKGAGVLYVKRHTPIGKIMFGGDQEFGLRPGTPNVALALGLAQALQITEKIKEKEVKRLTKLRDYFFKKLQEMSKTVFDTQLTINGDLKNRLPNNINIAIPNIPSDLLVIELSARGIMVSAKSACQSGDGQASYVIKAIRPDAKEENGSLRFSLGRQTTKADINYTIKALSEILTKLKKWY
ncbi:MAG: cysteine desulfurase family protein [Patescibacteria group bacterium]